MTIALPPEIEARLQDEALRHSLPLEEYVRKLVLEHLPPPKSRETLTELFAQWAAEDATDDPAELARREAEGEQFIEQLARNRLEMEGPDSRKPWP